MLFLNCGLRAVRKWVSLLLLVFPILGWVPAQGQPVPIHNYTSTGKLSQAFIGVSEPPQISPIFLEAWQGPNNLMYFHGPYGIYVFDGQHWDYLRSSPPNELTAVAHNLHGQIWMGGNRNFGKLVTGPKGQRQYQEIVNPDLGFPVPQIAKVLDAFSPGKDSIAFVTTNMMFYRYGAEAEWQTITPSTSFGKLWVIGQDSLLVAQEGQGLFYFNGSTLQLYDNQSIFNQGNLKLVLNHPEGGWILSDGQKLYRYQNKQLTQIFQEFTRSLTGGEIKAAIWLNNGYLALGTAAKGLYCLDPSGNTVLHLTRETGLVENGIIDLFIDRNEQLWVSTFNGLSRVDYTFPFPNFYMDKSTNGSVFEIMEGDDAVYFGSANGLYTYNSETITAVPGVAGAIHTIIPLEDEVLFGGNYGLFRMKDDEVRLQASTNTRDIIKTSDSEVIVAGYDGVFSFDLSSSGWTRQDTIGDLTGYQFFNMAQWQNNLYISTRSGEIFIVKPEQANQYDEVSITKLDSSAGVLPLTKIFPTQDSLLLGNAYGLYQFNEDQTRVLPDPRLGNRFNSGYLDVFRMIPSQDGLWLVSLSNLFYAEPTADGYQIDSALYRYFPGESIYALFEDSQERLWIGSSSGISLYNPIFPAPPQQKAKAQIRRVLLGDSIVYYGTPNPQLAQPADSIEASFLSKQNELTFYFSTPSFQNSEAMTYWYKLDGWDQDYIRYTGNENKVTYKNLSFGTYTFLVSSQDSFEQRSEEAAYTFIIQPPWYYQWWAFLIYGILLLFVIIGLVLLNTKRLRQAKANLEALVHVRTQELDTQKRQVEDQKAEIERKNHKIEEHMKVLEQKNRQIQNYNAELLESLRYAKRLQDSIFSSSEDLRRYLPESFLYSMPKEIVGGDFCWVSRVNNQVVLILADCTGHGVPGAFMSIVGHNQLQRFLTENKSVSPGEMLTSLDKTMREAVSHAESTAMKDGMDISIGVFDPDKRTFRYAGAFQSMYLIREREMREVKGNRYTAGVYFGATEKYFEEHVIAIEPEDIIYFSTDGIQDQFGGPYNNKLMKKGLRQILMEIHEEPFDRQHDLLASRVQQWMGSYEQVDDIMLVGVKF